MLRALCSRLPRSPCGATASYQLLLASQIGPPSLWPAQTLLAQEEIPCATWQQLAPFSCSSLLPQAVRPEVGWGQTLCPGLPIALGALVPSGCTGGTRGYAKLPYKPPSGKLPARPERRASEESPEPVDYSDQKMTPQDITNSMYMPWERRQFEGGQLKWWEKAYWVIFLVAVGALVVQRMYDPWKNTDGEADMELEMRREKDARAVLLGKSFLDDDDAFEGLRPEEIESFVKKHTGASIDDPFEGMTPDEINEYIKNNPEKAR